MAVVSASIQRGNDGFHISDFTLDGQAPDTNDIQIRVASADANGVTITRLDVQKALHAFERLFASGAIFTTTPPL